MKIAHIAPPWIAIPPKNYGGPENVIYNLVEEQVAQGHDVTLFAPGDAKTSAKHVSFFPTSLLASGVPLQAHPKAYYHLHRAVEYVKEHDFDIVHTHLSSTPDMYIFPLTAPLTTPHVTTLHSNFPFDNTPDGWTGDADEYYLQWAPHMPMVAISKSAQAEAPEALRFVGVVYNGISMKDFRPSGKGQGAYFAWLGRFTPEKGAHLAIEAAKRAGVSLKLAGNVQRHRDSMRYFKHVIEPQIDNEQVRYIGPVNMRQKVNLLSRARGFLNPIEWEEPFGMVMIEAMALGCPVISFARGAAPEIVVDGETGFLVRDVDEMVSCIPRIGEIARDVTRMHVEQNFSVHVTAERYRQVYREVIEMSRETVRSRAAAGTKPKPLITPAPPLEAALPALNQTRDTRAAESAVQA
jgi:glycosyltransferase involved in cell wall biosynthesis